MAEFIPVTRVIEEPTTIFISDVLPYLDARTQVQELAVNQGFEVATMPQLIRLLKGPRAREEIRKGGQMFADTASTEYCGTFAGERIYAVAHGMGHLNRLSRLRFGWNDRNHLGYIPLVEQEISDLMKSEPLYHLDEIKQREMPKGRYIVFFRLDKDTPNIHYTGQLYANDFLSDDIVLLRTGSQENRETLLQTLKEEGHESFGNYHPLGDVNGLDPDNPYGGPLYLNKSNFGLQARKNPDREGRFIAVIPEGKTLLRRALEKKVRSEMNIR